MLASLTPGTELRRFRKGTLPKIAVGVLLFIPLIYGALYLWAFWAPTEQLSNLPVALVNADQGAERDGEPIRAGDDIVDNLLDGGDLDWQVTDAADASTGVRDGDYYFSVTIPAGFSEAAVSVGTDAPAAAQIAVEYNDANSFLASTLGSSAMVQLRDAVAVELGTQTADALLVGLGEVGDGLRTAADGATTLADGIDTAKEGASTLVVGLGSLADGIDTLSAGAATLATKTGELAAGAATLTAGAGELATGAQSLDAGAADLVAFAQANPGVPVGALVAQLEALQSGAHSVATGAGTLSAGTSTLSSGAAQLATATEQLAGGASAASTGVGTIVDGAGQLSDGADQLSAGAHELSDALATGAADVPADSDELIAQKASVIADPVALDETWVAEADSFGEGFAPFFIALATFVGALITWLILRALPTRALAAGTSGIRAVMTGLLPALAIGLGQVVITMLVLVYGIGLQPKYWLATSAFIYLVTVTFLAMQQMFIILFGSAAGRVISLVLLMLQLTSSGGTYPVETTPAFFQALHPFMPASYVVYGLRELISGGVDNRLWMSLAYFVGLLVVSLAVSAWSAGRQRMWTIARLHPELSI